MFWGLFFLVIGLIIIVQTIFKIDLPILRILFGFLLIYWGLSVLFGSFGMKFNGFKVDRVHTSTEVIFTEGELRAKVSESEKANPEYSTVFGNSKLDLSTLSGTDLEQSYEINNVFGKTQIMTDSNLPIEIRANTVLGNIQFRGNKSGVIGNTKLTSDGFDSTKPHLKLEINCVFGEVQID